MGTTLSCSRGIPELHNVQITSVKCLCVVIEVFHPGIMEDSQKTVFLLQGYNFPTPGKQVDTLFFQAGEISFRNVPGIRV